MRREPVTKTPHLAATSNFTVLAPIKKGFVPALDTVTYKTRVKRVLQTLHVGRQNAHENELLRVMSDAVERVGKIHSVLITVLEPEDKVMLTVVFDGAWEAYVRVIWQKVARLLDLIFCNTEDYVIGWESSYADWGRWLWSKQVDSKFFYATPGVTHDDMQYLRMYERLHRRDEGSDLRLGQTVVPSAESIAASITSEFTDPTNSGKGKPGDESTLIQQSVRQGIRGVVGLHRLSDFFTSDQDGEVLHRAARELLPEFFILCDDDEGGGNVVDAFADRFEEALNWFRFRPSVLPKVRVLPPPLPPTPNYPQDDVQGGILEPFKAMTDGCLLLLAFSNRAALASFLGVFKPTTVAQANCAKPGEFVQTISFTVEGLRLAGFSEKELNWFPEDFRQGMAERAGLLGDVRTNHPRRWHLPALNWSDGFSANEPKDDEERPPGVRLEAVHAVIQMRVGCDSHGESLAAQKFLCSKMVALVEGTPGTLPLSIQWMRRKLDGKGSSPEHFGFADSMSSPVFSKEQSGKKYANQVHLGEVLLGYPNAADVECAYTQNTKWSDEEWHARMAIFTNGSFMVVRKLRQDLKVLRTLLSEAKKSSSVCEEVILAKMMGRYRDGTPLVIDGNPLDNDFNFRGDSAGVRCPIHAHIRRTNPRVELNDSTSLPTPAEIATAILRPPRIVRTGMPYGPFHNPDLKGEAEEASLNKERGLIFIAHNASLGEQFEVIQRWIAGGNSTGGYSGQSDPFLGVPESGRKRAYRFENDGKVVRVELDGSDKLGADQDPLVRLEWGSYFFSPSITALSFLKNRAGRPPHQNTETLWRVELGEREISRLRKYEIAEGNELAALAWKTALEDADSILNFVSASIWAAIRANHGGILRTPYGVLVASNALVAQVLANKNQLFSVAGYLPRMKASLGEIYLGLDDEGPDSDYQRLSKQCNEKIQTLSFKASYEDAFHSANAALEGLVSGSIEIAKDGSSGDGPIRWDLTFDVREIIDVVLADFCESWFGLPIDPPEPVYLKRGGLRWDWREGQPPYYPGHFTAPSRYFFQPAPSTKVESLGQAHGKALTKALIAAIEAGQIDTKCEIAKAVLVDGPGATNAELAARTLAGAMMGFLPTTDGNVRRVFNEWIRDGSFWQLRTRVAGLKGGDRGDGELVKILGKPLRTAMQLRPVPELVWRTVSKAHTLGEQNATNVHLLQGEQVVLALVSATHENIETAKEETNSQYPDGLPDVSPVFGGVRSHQNGSPTHACPGYDAAMGVLSGILGALIMSPRPLTPGAAPTTLAVSGIFQPKK